MSTWQVNKVCLSCKHYRLVDEMSGVCRVDKGMSKHFPLKLNEDGCQRWKDCGQQYYIRTGWIKAKTIETENRNKEN